MLAWAVHCALWVTAAVAINATHVVVGQTIDLSGMFAEFGVSSRAGLAAAFCEMNTAGGVLWRNLTLVTLDDGHIWYASVARGTEDLTDPANATDYWEYGHLLGHLSAYALTQQYLKVPFISNATMMTEWYEARLLKQQDVVVGPYSATACSAAAGADCECNLGARRLALVSPDQNHTDLFTYEATTCRVSYLPLLVPVALPSSDLALPVALGVSLGAASLVLLLWLAVRYGRRNNAAAPKDAAQPFCIVFTDIQSSTSLWATILDVMAGALDVHHRLIRKLIVKHKCYEVKTIGDSFMCATKSPTQAVRFALALQEEFVQHDWGTDRIDRVYAEMVGMEVRAPGCWNGLRVRVGIHYGYGNIKLDPVSKGYDYYGTVVNTAARIEGACHGGQIGVSEAVFLALDHHVPGAVCEDLGPQPLRGLAEPLRLYQVLPEGLLAQRRFPPLRIDRVDGKDEALASAAAAAEDPGGAQFSHPPHGVVPTDSSEASFGMHGKWAEMHPLVARGDITVEDLRHHYSILQIGLTTILAPLGKAFRQQVLRELCARLHVPNHGLEGPQLRSTLHGVIQRVLPATVAQQPGSDRRFSRASVGVHSDPSRPSPHRIAASLKDSPLSNRARADRHDWTQEAMSVEHADSL